MSESVLDTGGASELELWRVDKRSEELLEAALGGAWTDLPEQAQRDAKAAAVDLVKLAIRQFRGEDVAREIAFVQATIAGLAAVVAEAERERLLEGIVDGARMLGEILVALAKGALRGMAPGVTP